MRELLYFYGVRGKKKDQESDDASSIYIKNSNFNCCIFYTPAMASDGDVFVHAWQRLTSRRAPIDVGDDARLVTSILASSRHRLDPGRSVDRCLYLLSVVVYAIHHDAWDLGGDDTRARRLLDDLDEFQTRVRERTKLDVGVDDDDGDDGDGDDVNVTLYNRTWMIRTLDGYEKYRLHDRMARRLGDVNQLMSEALASIDHLRRATDDPRRLEDQERRYGCPYLWYRTSALIHRYRLWRWRGGDDGSDPTTTTKPRRLCLDQSIRQTTTTTTNPDADDGGSVAAAAFLRRLWTSSNPRHMYDIVDDMIVQSANLASRVVAQKSTTPALRRSIQDVVRLSETLTVVFEKPIDDGDGDDDGASYTELWTCLAPTRPASSSSSSSLALKVTSTVFRSWHGVKCLALIAFHLDEIRGGSRMRRHSPPIDPPEPGDVPRFDARSIFQALRSGIKDDLTLDRTVTAEDADVIADLVQQARAFRRSTRRSSPAHSRPSIRQDADAVRDLLRSEPQSDAYRLLHHLRSDRAPTSESPTKTTTISRTDDDDSATDLLGPPFLFARPPVAVDYTRPRAFFATVRRPITDDHLPFVQDWPRPRRSRSVLSVGQTVFVKGPYLDIPSHLAANGWSHANFTLFRARIHVLMNHLKRGLPSLSALPYCEIVECRPPAIVAHTTIMKCHDIVRKGRAFRRRRRRKRRRPPPPPLVDPEPRSPTAYESDRAPRPSKRRKASSPPSPTDVDPSGLDYSDDDWPGDVDYDSTDDDDDDYETCHDRLPDGIRCFFIVSTDLTGDYRRVPTRVVLSRDMCRPRATTNPWSRRRRAVADDLLLHRFDPLGDAYHQTSEIYGYGYECIDLRRWYPNRVTRAWTPNTPFLRPPDCRPHIPAGINATLYEHSHPDDRYPLDHDTTERLILAIFFRYVFGVQQISHQGLMLTSRDATRARPCPGGTHPKFYRPLVPESSSSSGLSFDVYSLDEGGAKVPCPPDQPYRMLARATVLCGQAISDRSLGRVVEESEEEARRLELESQMSSDAARRLIWRETVRPDAERQRLLDPIKSVAQRQSRLYYGFVPTNDAEGRAKIDRFCQDFYRINERASWELCQTTERHLYPSSSSSSSPTTTVQRHVSTPALQDQVTGADRPWLDLWRPSSSSSSSSPTEAEDELRRRIDRVVASSKSRIERQTGVRFASSSLDVGAARDPVRFVRRHKQNGLPTPLARQLGAHDATPPPPPWRSPLFRVASSSTDSDAPPTTLNENQKAIVRQGHRAGTLFRRGRCPDVWTHVLFSLRDVFLLNFPSHHHLIRSWLLRAALDDDGRRLARLIDRLDAWRSDRCRLGLAPLTDYMTRSSSAAISPYASYVLATWTHHAHLTLNYLIEALRDLARVGHRARLLSPHHPRLADTRREFNQTRQPLTVSTPTVHMGRLLFIIHGPDILRRRTYDNAIRQTVRSLTLTDPST